MTYVTENISRSNIPPLVYSFKSVQQTIYLEKSLCDARKKLQEYMKRWNYFTTGGTSPRTIHRSMLLDSC